jgi:hypothetical protein
MRYIRSSFPREKSFQSLHSSRELMVRRSSIVISSLRGSGFWTGRLSGKKGRTGAPAPFKRPLSMAIPASIPVTVLVADLVFWRAAALESTYASKASFPWRATRTLVIFLNPSERMAASRAWSRAGDSFTSPGLAVTHSSAAFSALRAWTEGARS